MEYVMTAAALAKRAARIANKYKTLYVMGCFGAPMNEANQQRYIDNYPYNRQSARAALIRAADGETYGFDCVCLIKGILWGWCADQNAAYGGAKYASNGVPDVDADGMIALCRDLSADFSQLFVGEALWTDGHIGLYVGGGLAVECTPRWQNGVQLTAVENLGPKTGYPSRRWLRHGKLPWVDYGQTAQPTLADEALLARAICWATEAGLIPEDGFNPDAPCTKGEMVEMLFRLHGGNQRAGAS